jgi:hypothetical protein
MLGSNLGRDIGYPELACPWFSSVSPLRVNSALLLRLDHYHYVPNTSQIINHPTIQRSLMMTKLKLNSVALVRERTIQTERPTLVGEVSDNFFG